MPEPKQPLNWQDIIVRTVIPGVLIAFTGFVSEMTITSISSKGENARLVTNLQIQREQAESNLRKDIFDQAVAALIGEEAGNGEIEDYSKRLLKLELLALNFGDSIRLSPLFSEFERDLNRIDDPAHFVSVSVLQRRLRSLAKRVASSQLSFLGQRGASVPIQIMLTPDGNGFCHGKAEYKWPDDEFQYTGDSEKVPAAALKELLIETATIALDEPNAETRYVIANFSDLDPTRKKVRVSLKVCRLQDKASCDTDDADAVKRVFTLDYFNFPTIDNTRLPNNDRFALALEDFTLGDTTLPADCPRDDKLISELQCLCQTNPSTLTVSFVLFPSEYASLRDRPTMRESLHLLESAQENSGEDEELR
jgi:hypothetical protein